MLFFANIIDKRIGLSLVGKTRAEHGSAF